MLFPDEAALRPERASRAQPADRSKQMVELMMALMERPPDEADGLLRSAADMLLEPFTASTLEPDSVLAAVGPDAPVADKLRAYREAMDERVASISPRKPAAGRALAAIRDFVTSRLEEVDSAA